MSEPAEIRSLVDAAVARFGRLDVLVNNAGVYRIDSLEAVTPESFDEHYRLNVRGLLLATQAAAHVSDVARLFRLVLEAPRAGARFHAVAEEGVGVRVIAEVLGAGLGLPVRSVTPEAAQDELGWMARFVQADLLASGAWPKRHLGWEPVGPDLLADLRAMRHRL